MTSITFCVLHHSDALSLYRLSGKTTAFTSNGIYALHLPHGNTTDICRKWHISLWLFLLQFNTLIFFSIDSQTIFDFYWTFRSLSSVNVSLPMVFTITIDTHRVLLTATSTNCPTTFLVLEKRDKLFLSLFSLFLSLFISLINYFFLFICLKPGWSKRLWPWESYLERQHSFGDSKIWVITMSTSLIVCMVLVRLSTISNI